MEGLFVETIASYRKHFSWKFLPFAAFEIIQSNDYKMYTGKNIVHMVVKSKQQQLVKFIKCLLVFISYLRAKSLNYHLF